MLKFSKILRGPYFLITIFSFVPFLLFFLNSNLIHAHDSLVHLPRMAAYYKALGDGQVPVRWAGDLNYGYGMPLFNFIYPLPYFISSFLLFLGLGLVSSFKIVLFLSFLFSGLFMFMFAKEFFKDNKTALLATVFYQFFPFRLVELLVRGSFGEVYAYTFLPLVLYGVIKCIRTKTMWSFVLTAFATALLVLSHNSVSFLFFGVACLFTILFSKTRKEVVTTSVALGCGLLLSMFYWFPAIMDHKYTYGDLYMKVLYVEHFAPLKNFFIPNLTNSSAFQTGGIAISLGLMQILTLVVTVWLLLRKQIDKTHKKIIVFSGFLLVISFFFMQPTSRFLWEDISLLRQFQFPWRFLGVCGFAIALLSPNMLKIFRSKNSYWLIIILTMLSTVVYWKPVLGYDKVDEKYYWNFPLNTTYYGETDVIWSAGPAKSYPKQPVEFAVGEGEVSNYSRKSQVHSYTVEARKNSVVADNTVYFPGWKAYVDQREVQIEFQDQNWRGLITFPVSKGVHEVRVVFTETRPRLVADAISLSALLFLCGLSIFLVLRRYEKK